MFSRSWASFCISLCVKEIRKYIYSRGWAESSAPNFLQCSISLFHLSVLFKEFWKKKKKKTCGRLRICNPPASVFSRRNLRICCSSALSSHGSQWLLSFFQLLFLLLIIFWCWRLNWRLWVCSARTLPWNYTLNLLNKILSLFIPMLWALLFLRLLSLCILFYF